MATACRNSRTVVFLLGVVAVAGFLAIFAAHTRADAAPPSVPSPDVVKLQQEHLATLGEVVKLEEMLYETGTGSYEQCARSKHDLLETELRYAPAASDRIAILQGADAAAKEEEKTLTQMAAVGSATPITVLEAKAYRLSIEVALAEETGK